MASELIEILAWKKKEQSLKAFIGLNLVFYLLVFGNYSLSSLVSSVLIFFIIVINAHGLVHKTKSEKGDFEYVSREVLEDLFIDAFKVWKSVKEALNRSAFDIFLAILALYLFNFFAGVFGVEGFLWILVDLAFVATPQYLANKELVDEHVGGLSEKVKEFKELAYELIPKYRQSS